MMMFGLVPRLPLPCLGWKLKNHGDFTGKHPVHICLMSLRSSSTERVVLNYWMWLQRPKGTNTGKYQSGNW